MQPADTEPKILVLDDEPALLQMMLEFLTGAGFSAIGAKDPADARRLLANQSSLSLLVTDLRMPGLDGVELARMVLAERTDASAVEVVLISGHGTMEDAVAALRMGAADFLAKPFRLAELHAACNAALTRAARRRAEALAEPVADTPDQDQAAIAALRAGRIIPMLQPLLRVPGGELLGFEALARCAEPDGRLLSPAQFLPALIDAGLTAELDLAIMAQAAQTIQSWRQQGLCDAWLFVNLASETLAAPDIVSRIETTLRNAGLPHGSVVLEVTEAGAISPAGLSVLRALRALGLRLALDDFGTGFSALSRLRDLPISIVKLDQSFLHPQAGSDDDMLTGLVRLAKSRGLMVLAEGVETAAEWAMVQGACADAAQGYWLGRPALPEALVAKLPSLATGVSHTG